MPVWLQCLQQSASLARVSTTECQSGYSVYNRVPVWIQCPQQSASLASVSTTECQSGYSVYNRVPVWLQCLQQSANLAAMSTTCQSVPSEVNALLLGPFRSTTAGAALRGPVDRWVRQWTVGATLCQPPPAGPHPVSG